MRRPLSAVLSFLCLFSSINITPAAASAPANGVKEWTFLVFLNGNNNLDSFGKLNVNQMEQVGSTADINVVVQWASLRNGKTQRLYVTQDNDSRNVTSPVVQDMGSVDMGDWKSLVDFVRWGVENYPAKHYFIDVWDHGSGWHMLHQRRSMSGAGFTPMDISWDDHTGSFITTQQLGQALTEAAQIIGHKVDLYGSDACLMAMAEIADEVADSVEVFAGSEEVEPGTGWPYHTFLKAWSSSPQMSASGVAKALTTEYMKAYTGGDYGRAEVTFSAFDLNRMSEINEAINSFGQQLQKLEGPARAKVVQAARRTVNFTYRDYADLADFMNNLESDRVEGLESETTQSVKQAIQNFVITNGTTDSYKRAQGVAIWLPTSMSTYKTYAERYKGLKFQAHTGWAQSLEALLK